VAREEFWQKLESPALHQLIVDPLELTWSPLHHVILADCMLEWRAALVTGMLGLGAPVNHRGPGGRTPLYVAMGRGDWATAVTLLERGAVLVGPDAPVLGLEAPLPHPIEVAWRRPGGFEFLVEALTNGMPSRPRALTTGNADAVASGKPGPAGYAAARCLSPAKYAATVKALLREALRRGDGKAFLRLLQALAADTIATIEGNDGSVSCLIPQTLY
jgi:hypothetical protein